MLWRDWGTSQNGHIMGKEHYVANTENTEDISQEGKAWAQIGLVEGQLPASQPYGKCIGKAEKAGVSKAATNISYTGSVRQDRILTNYIEELLEGDLKMFDPSHTV
ncbi:hypothetical protein GDO81_015028 [Engystomops pustulosus]|uniref:Uncharacterized protein n=1 Tax=Engystomops pustulosus TaxID=76066 RepID=A0AAV7AG89_ENGPU|nr:hypothetical protein GDO81_015028 [Engystomops pustulosus]KAG8560551.1 hypothetical protein GDO81_015028 [Engystomops pustulosus]